MSLPVILGPVAEREFEEAATRYQQDAGLGHDFAERVQEAFDRIARMPELPAMIYKNIRRVRIGRFPYHVFYRVLDDRIEVIVVFHGKRNPSIWKSRV